MKTRFRSALVLLTAFAALTIACALIATRSALAGGPQPPLVGIEPRWGPDLRVNPTPPITTDKHKNFSMAVDPSNPSRLLAGFDYRDSGGLGSGYSWSSDGGRTWSGGYFE